MYKGWMYEQVQPQSSPFPMAKDTDGPTVWSDGERNKYNPE